MKSVVARVSLEINHLWPTQIGHWLTGQYIRTSRYSYWTGIGNLEEDLSSELPYSAVNSTGDQPAVIVDWLKICIYSNFESSGFLWLAYKPPGALARMSNTENKPCNYSWFIWTLHLKKSSFRPKIFQDLWNLNGDFSCVACSVTLAVGRKSPAQGIQAIINVSSSLCKWFLKVQGHPTTESFQIR